MEHPRLNPREKKIVSEACGRVGAQLLEQVPKERWPDIVLAIVVELSGQVLRFVEEEDERTDPQVRLPSEAPL